jgi:hypothetical protein
MAWKSGKIRRVRDSQSRRLVRPGASPPPGTWWTQVGGYELGGDGEIALVEDLLDQASRADPQVVR